MQELLFSETPLYDDGFDDFELEKLRVVDTPLNNTTKSVALFIKQDNNGKHIYLVGDRFLTARDTYQTVNVLEFKHSKDRAEQEFKERTDG